MKKSNKLTFFYIATSLLLFVGLAFCGGYGVYMSIGISFVNNNIAGNVSDINANNAENMSFGGSINFPQNMVGIIILSIILIIIAVFDLISLFKQVIFFKQFKCVRESKIENKIEKKVKSKGGVIVFAIILDIASIVAGIFGLVVNTNTFVGRGDGTLLFILDILIIIFSVLSGVLLLIKVGKVKKIKDEKMIASKIKSEQKNVPSEGDFENEKEEIADKEIENAKCDINDFEYNLLKLKFLKSSKIINNDEYEFFRKKYLSQMGYCEVKTQKKKNGSEMILQKESESEELKEKKLG